MSGIAPRALLAGGAMLLACIAGCASQGGARLAPTSVVDTTTFAADLGVDLKQFTRLSSGVYYYDLAAGTTGATAGIGRRITFRYLVHLPNGELVEGQRDPLEAEINDGMIRGLRYGLTGMRQGGSRRLVIPPSLGYGRSQFGVIPPNSVLVFDVELISVR